MSDNDKIQILSQRVKVDLNANSKDNPLRPPIATADKVGFAVFPAVGLNYTSTRLADPRESNTASANGFISPSKNRPRASLSVPDQPTRLRIEFDWYSVSNPSNRGTGQVGLWIGPFDQASASPNPQVAALHVEVDEMHNKLDQILAKIKE